MWSGRKTKLIKILTFDFNEGVLFNNVCHRLFLLFALIDLLLQFGDLLVQLIESMAVRRTICDGADERRVRVFKWLNMTLVRIIQNIEALPYRVLLLTRQLTWRLEIDSEKRELAFIRFARVLYRVHMERDGEPMYREHNG